MKMHKTADQKQDSGALVLKNIPHLNFVTRILIPLFNYFSRYYFEALILLNLLKTTWSLSVSKTMNLQRQQISYTLVPFSASNSSKEGIADVVFGPQHWLKNLLLVSFEELGDQKKSEKSKL